MKKHKTNTIVTEQDDKYKNREPKTDVESDTGKRPEHDSNPLPPNPNKVDNHDD